MNQADLDEAIRTAFEQRANRRGHDTHHDSGVRASDEGRRSPSRRGRSALAACVALLVLAAGLVLLRVARRDDPSVTVDTPGEIAPFEPDLTTLPFPKYYRGGGASTAGTGSLVAPWRPHHDGEPTPLAEHVSMIQVYESDGAAATVVPDTRRFSRFRTSMTWAVPSQGGRVSHDGMRFRDAEVGGIVFQAATDDPEVTDGQLQAMLDRMVDQYEATRGEPIPARDDDPSVRLTPRPAELPEFPSTAELERQYAATPEEERDWIDPWRESPDGLGQQPEGRTMPARDRHAFAVFNLDGTFQGIYVAGLGVVDRDVYEDPAFDPEHATSHGF